MTNIKINNSLISALPIACLLLLGAFSATVSGAEEIEEIQVTATRRALDTHDVSPAVTVVAGDTVSGNTLLTDALQGQAGAYLQETTPGQGAAFVRGLRGSAILHLVDGMRLNNSLFRSAPTQYLALVDPAIVEQVEIERGAAASLYGNDAMGGVVQVITRRPNIDSTDFMARSHATLSLDSADLAKGVSLSSDFGTAAWASTATISYTDIGDRRIGGGDRVGPSGYESKSVRFATYIQANEQRHWFIDLQFTEQPFTPRIDELVPGYGETEPSSAEFAFAPNQRSFAHVQYEHSQGLFAADWTLDAGWQRIVDDRVTRSFGSNSRHFEENRSDLLGISARAYKAVGELDWVFGAEWYRDSVASASVALDIDNGTMTTRAPRFPDASGIDQGAIYGNLGLPLGAGQHLNAGLRYSHVRIDIPSTSDYAGSAFSKTDLSGELGWLYELSGTVNFVVNAGRGFRAPNIFDLGTLGDRPGNRFNIPATTLEPEHVVQLDAGLKYDNGRLRGEIMAWRLRYTDRIISVLTGEVTEDGREIVQSANVARSAIHGIEAAARLQLSDRLAASAVINLSRGTDRDETGLETAADRMPPVNGRVTLNYDVNDRWEISPHLLFAAGQERLSPRDIGDVRINPNGTPGWAVVGLSSNHHFASGLQLQLRVDNLLDKNYRVHGSGIDARGLNVGIAVSYDW